MPCITICSFYHILKVADKFRVVSLIHFSPIITSRNIRISLPNTKSKGVCPLEEWTLLWLSQIGCLTSSSCSSSVISCTLVSLFERLLRVHLPPYPIYLLSDHIHHGVRILRLEPYQQSRTDTHACLACSQPHWEDHHWPQRRHFFFCSAYDHTRLH